MMYVFCQYYTVGVLTMSVHVWTFFLSAQSTLYIVRTLR